MISVDEVAQRYGIALLPGRAPEGVAESPNGNGGCEPWTRRVWAGYGASALAPYEVLHEIAHVVCYVPTRKRRDGLRLPDESALLIPFERQLARVMSGASPSGVEFFRSVTAWQKGTSIAVKGADGRWDVGDFDTFGSEEHTDWWQAGLALARKVGLLDYCDAPTWEHADWARLTRAERRRLLSGYVETAELPAVDYYGWAAGYRVIAWS
jgi:hypothetical protein